MGSSKNKSVFRLRLSSLVNVMECEFSVNLLVNKVALLLW